MAPESDSRSLEERRWKAMLGVWRNGAGKRCSECGGKSVIWGFTPSQPFRLSQGVECGGMAPENDARSLEDWPRKAMLGVWRNGAGSKAWSVALDCAFDQKCRLVPKVFCTKTAQSSRPTKLVEQYQRYSIPRLRSSQGRQNLSSSTKIFYTKIAQSILRPTKSVD